MPTLPTLPAGGTTIDTGTRVFTIAVGQKSTFDMSVALPAPPPCPSLNWVVAWRATDPLAAAIFGTTRRVELGSGRWGTAEMGGSLPFLELRNDGAETVSGELAYALRC